MTVWFTEARPGEAQLFGESSQRDVVDAAAGAIWISASWWLSAVELGGDLNAAAVGCPRLVGPVAPVVDLGLLAGRAERGLQRVGVAELVRELAYLDEATGRYALDFGGP